jgi:hypothetical protein
MADRHPAPYRGRPPSRELRVSDDARERTVRFLRRAYRRGHISVDELDERSEAAYTAVTRADLSVVTRDLPGRQRLRRAARRRSAWRGFWRRFAPRRRRR